MSDKGVVSKGLLERMLANLLGKIKVYPDGRLAVALEGGYSYMYLYQYAGSIMFQIRTQNEFQNGLRNQLVKV